MRLEIIFSLLTKMKITSIITVLTITCNDKFLFNYNRHEDILKDKERIMPFINAIQRNKHLFENKIVLDINCGTGILSIMAAR